MLTFQGFPSFDKQFFEPWLSWISWISTLGLSRLGI